jgi:hypothetical protein
MQNHCPQTPLNRVKKARLFCYKQIFLHFQ